MFGLFQFLPPVRVSFVLFDVLEVLSLLILVEVIRSWLVMFGTRGASDREPWVRALHTVIGPVLAPFRVLWEAILNGLGRSFRMQTYALRRFDFSPIFAWIAIGIAQNILFRVGVAGGV